MTIECPLYDLDISASMQYMQHTKMAVNFLESALNWQYNLLSYDFLELELKIDGKCHKHLKMASKVQVNAIIF